MVHTYWVGQRRIAVCFVLLIVLMWGGDGTAVPQLFAADGCGGEVLSPAISQNNAREAISLINKQRAGEGLPPYKIRNELMQSAAYHVVDMREDDYYAIYTQDIINGELTRVCGYPKRIRSFYDVKDNGDSVISVVGTALVRSPQDIIDVWMLEESTRPVIFSSDLREIGLAEDDSNGVASHFTADLALNVDSFPVVINLEAAETDESIIDLYVYGDWEEMRVRVNGGAWSDWFTFMNELQWELTTVGDNEVEVEMRTSDPDALHPAAQAADTITYEPPAPTRTPRPTNIPTRRPTNTPTSLPTNTPTVQPTPAPPTIISPEPGTIIDASQYRFELSCGSNALKTGISLYSNGQPVRLGSLEANGTRGAFTISNIPLDTQLSVRYRCSYPDTGWLTVEEVYETIITTNPTETPTSIPTSTKTSRPTNTPRPANTSTPRNTPTTQPTSRPTNTPTPRPTNTPTITPDPATTLVPPAIVEPVPGTIIDSTTYRFEVKCGLDAERARISVLADGVSIYPGSASAAVTNLGVTFHNIPLGSIVTVAYACLYDGVWLTTTQDYETIPPPTPTLPPNTTQQTVLGSAELTPSNDLDWDYALGYIFTPDVDGTITRLGGYFDGTKQVKLFDSDGNILAEATVTAANNWSYSDITPIAINTGESYTVAVYVGGTGAGYDYIGSYPLNNASITITSAAVAYTGRDPAAVPTAEDYAFLLGMPDIEFQPDN